MFLESTLLAQAGFRHAFFTRIGGVSRPPFDTLHFGAPAPGDEASLGKNLELAARALSIEPSQLYVVTQVHGRATRTVRPSDDREAVREEQGDALVATSPGLACGIKVADCMPILVGDRKTGAALAIHSGWQGTVLDVIAAGVGTLRDA